MTTEKTPLEVINDFHKTYEEMRAIDQQRMAAMEKGLETAEYDAKIAALEAKTVDYDKLQSQLVMKDAADKQKAELEQQIEDLKTKHGDKIDELTAALARPRLPDGDPETKTQEYSVYDKWLRYDEKGLTVDEIQILTNIGNEKKTLTVGDDASLGYQAPKEVVNGFTTELSEDSPLRQLLRVRNTGARALDIPTLDTDVEAEWVDETEERTAESDALSLGMITIPVFEMTASTTISRRSLEDVDFNVEQEIRKAYISQFAAAENKSFLNGNGIKRPEGILFHKDIQAVNSGAANGITFEGIMNLVHSIKTGYQNNSHLLFNRSTLGAMRLIKDGSGQYMFQAGMSGVAGVPSMIAGQRYLEMPMMPNIAANATPVLFGDFNKGYVVVDRVSLETNRDPYTKQRVNQIVFTGRRRVGGKVVLPEAIKKMIIKA